MSKKGIGFDGAKYGPVRYFGKLRICACEGMLLIVDERQEDPAKEGDCTVISPNQMLERIQHITAKYRQKTAAEMEPWQRAEYVKHIKDCQEVFQCVKEAIDMGDPTDPKVQEFWARHRGRPQVSFAAAYDNSTGPATIFKDRLDVVRARTPDLVSSVKHKMKELQTGLILPPAAKL